VILTLTLPEFQQKAYTPLFRGKPPNHGRRTECGPGSLTTDWLTQDRLTAEALS
jgi:hypothetical protein